MIDFERGQPAGKVMFYSHDTYGLGHLRRTLTLAAHLRSSAPGLTQLIVTGSPAAGAFPLPAGTDLVKLPSVTKDAAGAYVSRSLESSFSDVRDMRSDLFLSAARHFAPDLLIVDHAPAGLKGEAIATLRYLKQHLPDTRLVLGLRDIVDEAPKVRQTWAREGVYDLLDTVYDGILGYGRGDLYDTVREYGLSHTAAAKFRHVGYLGRPAPVIPAARLRWDLALKTDRLVVVAAGGGGDGQRLFRAVLRGMRKHGKHAPFDVLVIGGPLMEPGESERLRELLGRRRNLHYVQFTDQMTSYLAAADLVITMGGYNTVCELLTVGTPAVIVPRVAPRKEQLIRAELLRDRGVFDMIHPDDLDPKLLIRAIADRLERPPAVRATIPLDGLANVVTELATLAPHLGLRADPATVPVVATA